MESVKLTMSCKYGELKVEANPTGKWRIKCGKCACDLHFFAVL